MTVADEPFELHHVVVVGGSPADWAAATEAEWQALLADLGKVADHFGASWLTMHPIGPTPPSPQPLAPRRQAVGACLVAAHPDGDGRAHVAAAVERLRAQGRAIDEASIDAIVNEPAGADPDLVVVLGPPTVLPVSLVWELAYSELVFVDIPWRQLTAAHLEDAVASYAHRHRRFGAIN